MQTRDWEEFYQNPVEHKKFLEEKNTQMQDSLKAVGLIK